MKLNKRVNINQGVSVYITNEGVIDHNFEFLWKGIVPKRCMGNYTINLPTHNTWQNSIMGGNIELRNPLHNDSWHVLPLYDEYDTNRRLLQSKKCIR